MSFTAHAGWGPSLFIKDIFPDSKLCCFFEWFYHAHGSDADFDPSFPLDADGEARIRAKNATILLELNNCDQGLCPTYWQKAQFPKEFHSKLEVLHDGIDTDFFKPKPNSTLKLPSLGLDLSHVDEVVTYVGRGMEPYRGFPQFMESVVEVQRRRPHCHVVVVGEDRVAYGTPLANGKTYKQLMLDKLSLDPSRLHFTGPLPYPEYKQVLQASTAHVYLTRPFVLSWSMLEAMATGCLVIGSDTEPVREVIEDGRNGLLSNFFSPKDIAERVDQALDSPEQMAVVRSGGRSTIEQRYALKNLLPRHVEWLRSPKSGGSEMTAAA